MDSRILFNPITPCTELQLARIYGSLPVFPPRSSLHIVSVQQQEGVHDCGLFSVAYATEVCLGRKPESVSFDQQLMRQHLINCLNEKHFQSFPKSTCSETLPQPTNVVKYILNSIVCVACRRHLMIE